MIGEKQVEREEDHLLNFALWALLLRIAGHHLAILLNIVIDGVVVSYFYFSVDETQHQFQPVYYFCQFVLDQSVAVQLDHYVLGQEVYHFYHQDREDLGHF